MKKSLLLAISLFAFSTITLAQVKSTDNKVIKENIYTSLKPADGQPAVFSSQEELNGKLQDKKDKTILLIKENEKDPVQVKMYREQLWRFENAIVQEPKKQKSYKSKSHT